MITLTKCQQAAYAALETAIEQGTESVDQTSALTNLCLELETALKDEDARLSDDGTSVELDDRWILNLHRLERMRDLLARAMTVPNTSETAA